MPRRHLDAKRRKGSSEAKRLPSREQTGSSTTFAVLSVTVLSLARFRLYRGAIVFHTVPSVELTKKQAAELKRVSVKTIERWIAEGLLEAYRYGPRLVRIKADALESMGRPIHPNFEVGG